MKKMILTGASLLALTMAGPAFAQSTSTVTQDGNGNDAGVVQENSNVSDINQVGDNNVADVEQTSTGTTGNEVDIDQTATGSNTANALQTAGATGSFIDILQDGTSDGNTANASQASAIGSSSEITQTDTTGSFAETAQGGGGGINNGAVIIQGDTSAVGGTLSGAFNANSIIRQEGDDNFALSVQGGGDQTSLIDQFGPSSGNFAQVAQGAFSDGSSNAFVQQLGDNGVVDVSQNSSLNDAFVLQLSGDGNQAVVDQGLFAGGDTNAASILQDGDGNFSEIEQNALTAGGTNLANNEQTGNGNISFITQEDSGNMADVVQNGDGHTSTVNQSGTGNVANVAQGTPPAP